MCQRLSGSTHAVNALIEASKLDHLSGGTVESDVLTPSGHGQVITRCASCLVAVWSEYRIMNALSGVALRFIRAGTLDHPDRFPPDVHIYAATMQPHFERQGDTPVFEKFYDLKQTWAGASLDRLSHAHASRHQTSPEAMPC